MIVSDKPPLAGVYIEHFGVKGMKWGRRKGKSSGSSSKDRKASTKKKVIVAGVAAGVVGAAAVAYMMSRRGNVSVGQVMGKRPGLRRSSVATASKGRRAASDISQSEWKKRVADLRKDIAGANADQDRWMRRQGLGAKLNRKTTDVDMGDLNDVRRAWNDPNHVWVL